MSEECTEASSEGRRLEGDTLGGVGCWWRDANGPGGSGGGVSRVSAASDVDGQALIQDPIEVAASYLFYLCRNHPFVDGNKRVALATCLVFLSENGLLPSEALDADAWERLTLDVAASRLDRIETAGRLRTLLVPTR